MVPTPAAEIDSFTDCVQAGYPIKESFPRQCSTPSGDLFVEEVDPDQTPPADATQDTKHPNSTAEAIEMASEAVKNSLEYQWGGYHLETIKADPLRCPGCWEVFFQFRRQGDNAEIIDVVYAEVPIVSGKVGELKFDPPAQDRWISQQDCEGTRGTSRVLVLNEPACEAEETFRGRIAGTRPAEVCCGPKELFPTSPRPLDPPEIMCTMEYAPVCAEIQPNCFTTPCPPMKQTFSNRCHAEAAEAENIQPGKCDQEGPITGMDKGGEEREPKESGALQSGSLKIQFGDYEEEEN
ncbi:MAG: hypothetical protein K9M51_03755 [Candidatus Gracilibacteria bacterium]|nr:hypothetical protein [Candidatus Gracilibacteria bacterium]